MPIASYSQTIKTQGFNCIDKVFNSDEVAVLRAELETIIRCSDRKNYGVRRLLEKVPAVPQLCQTPQLRSLIEPILGKNAFAVRGIFFDKTPTANWGVYWHQDLTIAVKKRIDTPGFSPWSVKEGINCVQPAIAILERMLTLRVHLDDVNTNNGPLSVIPGSHRQGILQQKTRETVKNTRVNCSVKSGGVVVMRPLLLHGSRSALQPNRRRVIHLEFAAEKLPNGLEWYEQYPIFANS